ncbi:MAG: polysaccharide biosynthesis protein [Aphanizomenon flos-aquae LD13]|jgi:O-antigen/teichoic acid export membrane protein|uniref:Polysaccharide biosynthesis protein n=1 Tax=Aphanizomenon flos-aquae LD13 TaxID=1710894 RepID=A0A1B7VIA5_APHFL|nr:polysaccharide biosynthesis protein [Aphanizomenon flos-aquae UKL13-PB]OBQ18363.1 MAG: polysaccharide biosynthesis protein [Aphanizomenon flos-aquae LD13]HCQ20310.1 polysaccharide biosynthesis protein [Anabaena sp. UBA12330]
MLTPKIQYWIKTLSKFISIQLIVQALNLASGILIIRTLSKQEYAYFTLANAMQATMNTLADSGIGSALSAIGGRVWQDPYRFGQLINTAMYLRRYLAVIATLVVTPILFWMLLQNGASIGYTLLLISAILIELYFYLNIGVLIVVPRLYSKIDKLQQLSLLSSGSRFLFLIGGSLIFLNALVGAFSSTVASGLENLMLWFSVKDTIDVKSEINKEDKIEILKIVKTQAPNTIFYCIQGQVTIWLITVFGNTDNIAEVGALGRLAVIFSLITSIMTNIVLPSFSRTQSYEILIRKYKQIIFSYVFLSLIILLLSMVFPKQLLLILGKNYSSLEKELFFFAMAAVTNAITSILWSINASKGWTEEAWLFIPTIIITQIILLLFLDVSNIIGISIFSTLSVIPASCINFYMTYKGISQTRDLQKQN